MKKLLLTFILSSLFLSTNAFAAKVKCGPAKFDRLYNKDGKVYIQLAGLGWHVLGFEGDNDLSSKLDKISKAEHKGRYVQLEFPNGYPDNCMVMDDTVAVKKVKVKKTIEAFNNDDDD